MSELKEKAAETIKIDIAENNSDLVEKEEVNLNEDKKFAEENNAILKIISAKDRTEINQLFMSIPVGLGVLNKDNIQNNAKTGGSKGVKLSTKTEKKREGKCC